MSNPFFENTRLFIPGTTADANEINAQFNDLVTAFDDVETAKFDKAGGVFTGAVGVTAGTEVAPGVYISGDTDTGFYSPAPNNFGISTGGVGRFLLSNTLLALSVGLMVSGSTALAGLTVSGNATFGDAAGDTVTINGTAVSIPNGLNFDSNTLVIDAANNFVGIGTNTPARSLTVYQATSAFVQLANATTGVTQADGGYISQQGLQTIIANREASDLILATSDIARLTIDSAGNAGLGVPPVVGLNFRSFQLNRAILDGGVNDRTTLSYNYARTGGVNTYIGSDFASIYQQIAGNHQWLTAPSGIAGNPITFTQAMTLTQGGNLLVGGTADEGSYITAGSRSATSASIRTQTADGATGFSGLIADGAGATALIVGASGTSGLSGIQAGVIYTTQAKPLILGASNAEAARITSARFFKASNTGSYTEQGNGDSSAQPYHQFQSNQTGQASLYVRHTSTDSAASAVFAGLVSGATGYLYRGFTGVSEVYQVLANGSVQNATGVYGSISDAKLKNILGPAPSYWEKYKLIEWVKYVLKNDPTNQEMLGVIAQQVQGIFPGLIQSTPDMEKVIKTRDVTVTRQVTVTKLEPTTRTEVMLENGKWVRKIIEETVEVAEPQFDEYDLFDELGNVVLHLVSPEIQAVEGRPAIISEEGMVIEPAIEAVDYQPALYEPAKHKVPRMESVVLQEEYEEMVPTGTHTLSVKYSILGHIGDVVLQEAMARIEALEMAA